MNLFTWTVFLTLLLGALGDTSTDSSSLNSPFWSGHGGNKYNNRWAANNKIISSSSLDSLTLHCQVPYEHGESATPTIYGNIAYYPTWNFTFVALDYTTCTVLWQINVTDIIANSGTGPITAFQSGFAESRSSPQVDGDILYFTTLAHALVVAVNRATGALLATKQVHINQYAMASMSPTLYDGRLFLGVSSAEEGVATADYKCCTFVGKILAVSFNRISSKFDLVWEIPLIPAELVAQGWSGVGAWGSQPSIDASRGQVFFGTGNTYSVPQSVVDCQYQTANITSMVSDPCLPKTVLQESILAVDMESGLLNWVHQLPPLDAWVIACGLPGELPQNKTACPQKQGPDADFGMAPTFIPGSDKTPYGKDTVVVGQKNGIVHAVSAQTGHPFWSTLTNPGSAGGGLSWGLAVDDSQVYFTAINAFGLPWTLSSGQNITKSGWGALSLLDGHIVWTVAAPNNGWAQTPVSVVGDLVLAGRAGDTLYGGTGAFVVLKKTTGEVLKSVNLTGAYYGGIAVQGQNLLFGTGYGGMVGNVPGTGYLYVYKVGA